MGRRTAGDYSRIGQMGTERTDGTSKTENVKDKHFATVCPYYPHSAVFHRTEDSLSISRVCAAEIEREPLSRATDLFL